VNLQSDRELANTRAKLRLLEEEYEATRDDASEEPYLREATLRSLRRLINQFREEIARYEAHQPMRR